MCCLCFSSDLALRVVIRCDEERDPCANNPCLNGGSCDVTSDFRYICNCTNGYTGQNCETDIGKL